MPATPRGTGCLFTPRASHTGTRARFGPRDIGTYWPAFGLEGAVWTPSRHGVARGLMRQRTNVTLSVPVPLQRRGLAGLDGHGHRLLLVRLTVSQRHLVR